MLNRTLLALLLALTYLHLPAYKCFAQGQKPSKPEIDGAYDFVSEKSALTAPEKTTRTRTAADWERKWIFCNGHYSRIMKAKTLSSSEYIVQSSAGRYEFNGEKLRLNVEISWLMFPPGWESFDYHFDGDMLILTETLKPYVESISEGTITTVLRRRK
ncbi:MAG: hypothetical protein LC785_12665 [Acidobacteria bacterium]|nr:hypothetical protein [Acidobacteriota bacterium]MCA1642770.1 hypothetical protein [Acidobacteriota bacterium]